MTSDDSLTKTPWKLNTCIVSIFSAIMWHLYIDQHGWGVQFAYTPISLALASYAIVEFVKKWFLWHNTTWFKRSFILSFCGLMALFNVGVVHWCFLGVLYSIVPTRYLKISLPVFLISSHLIPDIELSTSWLQYILPLLLITPSPNEEARQQEPSISIDSMYFSAVLVGLMTSATLNHFWLILTPDRSDLLNLLALGIVVHGTLQKYIRSEYFAVALPIIWISLGWLSIQQVTGSQLSLTVGSIIVLMVVGLPSSIYVYGGLGIGLYAQSLFTSTLPEANGFLLITLLWLIFSKRRLLIGLGTLLFGFTWFTERGPIIPSSPSTIWTSYITRVETHPIWDNNGWYFVEKLDTSELQMSTFVNNQKPNTIFIENTPITTPINNSSNQMAFASLIHQWNSNSEQMAILSDISGHVNTVFQSTTTQIHLQTSQDIRTQLIAEQHPTIKTNWLKPNRIIHRATPTELIYNIDMMDVIVEVVHLPWESSISTGLTQSYFKEVKSSLSSDGTYYLILELHSFPEGALEIISMNVEAVFSNHLYMLPKDNIDSLMIVAQHHPFSFQEMKKSLGDEGTSVLGRILTDTYPKTNTRPPRFISAKDRPSIPFTHLTVLSSVSHEPDDIWPDLTEQDAISLTIEFEHHKEYLTIVEEGVKGNIEPIQNHSLPTELQRSLIQPHLKAAKRHILSAQSEGQSSTEWAQAQRYALTAQMIAPTESEPWILLGEIALGEGLLDKAVEKFNHVYTTDRTSLPAINGLARVAGLEEDFKKAEALLVEAQTVAPTNWTTYYNLAVFHQEHGTLDTTFTLLTKALELPNGDNPKTRIALVEYFISQERWTRALLEIDRLIQQEPEASATLWFLRGRIHFGLKIWDKAEIDFRKATLVDPNFHAARGSIGVIKMIQGDLEGAAQAFRATLRFDPNNEAARQNIQIVQERLSNPSNRTSP